MTAIDDPLRAELRHVHRDVTFDHTHLEESS
jgi:hypothetical protein